MSWNDSRSDKIFLENWKSLVCSKSGLSWPFDKSAGAGCSSCEGSGSGTYQLLIDTQFVRLLWGFRKIHNGWWNKATEGRSVFWQDLDLSALVLILCEPQVQPEDLTFCYPTSYTTEHLFGYSYWHNDFHCHRVNLHNPFCSVTQNGQDSWKTTKLHATKIPSPHNSPPIFDAIDKAISQTKRPRGKSRLPPLSLSLPLQSKEQITQSTDR